MLETLKHWLGGGPDLPDENTIAVGLLVEVIRMDHDFDAAERKAVVRILNRRFGMSEDVATAAIKEATTGHRTTYDDNQLLKLVHDTYSREQKVALLEMLWEIALADGELHRLENHAIYAIANQLDMGQAELDATKATATARLGA